GVPVPRAPAAVPWRPSRARGWRHPAALGVAAVALLVFGVALGVGIVRYTEPERTAAAAPSGSRPLEPLEPPPTAAAPPSAANAPRGPVTPAILPGMLEAARASLVAGRSGAALAPVQPV